ncbi:HYR domain-containing protein [Salegentibacter sp. Hel_I_6]|uniref:HYR domain-containing protein n=1 Tax=Salegentibacter sp. Hel_I_6 TaxID=1250278 RepID=UPI00055EF2B5|nr:HYR domain-containing protein [Salegentibacter sp. Hel_I_6]
MEKNYFKANFITLNFSLVIFTLFFISLDTNAQVIKEFQQRTSQYSTSKKIYNLKGDFTMIGNTNLSLWFYDDNTNNSNNFMRFVDADEDDSTKNSSSAILQFSNENEANPECSNIVYAGLYWSGRTNSSGNINDKRKIKLKGPNNSNYQNFTANQNDILFPGPSNMYAAYVEVTELVRNNGTGEYWVADMELSEGNGGATGYYGGWGMIVIYENSQMNWRDITVFDGYAHVEGNVVANYQLPVSGFNTAQSGPVNMKMGIMAGEGDIAISGDYFQIKKNNSNSWLSLSHDQNTSNNFFNSSIENNGTGRTPNLSNNTGIDISMFNIPNPENSVIGNNQTNTTFRYGSTQDTYSIFSIAMSVDAYIPEIEGVSTLSAINGNMAGNPPYNAVPGDELSYKVELKNKGTENVEDVKVVIPVPYNADYLPNSLSPNFYFSPIPQNTEVYFDPTLGATGSIVWEIDELPLANSTNDILADLTIKFGVTKNCTILSNICPGFDLIRFNGNISGRGAITGTTFQNKGLIQGYETEGTCQGEPITTPFEVAIDATNFRAENCQNSDEARKFVYCNREDPIGIAEINSGFPNGTRFFNESPVTSNSTEYTPNNPIPNNSGATEYYAVIPGTENCAIPFTIEITTIASVPETESITYCIDDEANILTAVATNPDFNLYYYISEDDTSPKVQIIPSTSQSGEFIYYVAEGESASCISPNKAPIKVSVIGEPEITAPQNQTIQTCDKDFIDYSIPGLSNNFTTITQQVFTDLGGSISFTEEIENISYKDILQQQSPAVYQRIFRITYECGNIDVQQSLTLENVKTQLEPVYTKKDPTCENENGVLTITNFNTDYIYELNSATGNLELNNATSSLSPGVYTLSVALNECVYTTNSFEVLPAPALPETPEIIEVAQPTCNVETGKITVNATEGYLYSLDGEIFQESNIFEELSPGNYVIYAQNEDECISQPSKNVIIEENEGSPELPEATVSQQPTCQDTTGTISVTTVEGITYTLLDSNENTLNNAIENGGFSNLLAGTYFVQASNGDCEATSEAIIIEENEGSPAQPEAVVSQQPTCEDTTGTISVTNVEGITYTLLDENENALNNAIENGDFSGLAAGTYFVQASNGDCEATSEAIVIEENEGSPVQPEAFVSQQPTCEDTTGTISVTTVEGITYTLLDSNENALSNTIENGEFSDIAAGSYFVQTSNGDCEAISEAIIIEGNEGSPELPEATISQQPTCEDTNGAISVTTVEGITYTLLDENENAFNNAIENGVFSDLAAGTYFIQAINGDCEAISEAIVIEENQGSPEQPEATVSQQPTCEDTTGTISVTTVEGITYTLLDSNENALSNTIENGEFSDIAAGSYFVQASNGDCEAISEAIIIEGNEGSPELPEATISQQPTCEDTNGAISVTTVEGITYTLLDENENAFNNAIENGVFSDLAAGTYFIQAINGDCEAISEAIVIEENQGSPEQPEATVSQQPTCEDTTGTISVTTVEGITYTLLDSNENALSNTIENGEFSDIAAGSYFVQASNGDCEAISQAIVIEEIQGSPEQPEAIVSQQPTCEDITGTISVTTVDGITYTLLDSNEDALNNTIENGEFTNLSAGTYFIQASNGDCEAISEAILIEENEGSPEAPVITAVTNTTCEENNGIIEFELSEGLSYILKDSEENEYSHENGIISNLASGTYYLVAQNNDCETTSEVIVEADLDEEAPVIISCPTDLTSVAADEGMCSASNLELGDLVAEDNCNSELSITNDAPEVFEPGETIVTWTVSDLAGNEVICTQTITVIDNQAPVIADVETINTTADVDTCGAMIEIAAPQVNDNCSVGIVSGTRDDNQPLDAEYPVGTTTIIWTATDENGNEAESVTQTVNVADNQAPVIADVETINTTADVDTCGAMIEIAAPQANDNCSVGNVIGTRDDNQPLDAEYPVGTTTLTWTATDENGNEAEPVTQTVNVEDNQAPVIADVETINTTTDADTCGAMIEITAPQANDNCSVGMVNGTRDDSQALEAEYPVGITTITWTVTDENGNQAEPVIQTVMVTDNQSPVIECPENMIFSTESGVDFATVNFENPLASDNCEVNVEQTGGATSGSQFPIGTNTVTFTATDASGNTTQCSFDIIVEDTENPTLECPSDIISSTDSGICGAIVEFEIPEGFDNSGNVTVEQTAGLSSGEVFPVGTTTITFTTSDEAGNTASCSFEISVVDDEAPVIEDKNDITVNTDPDLCGAIVDYELPSATDDCGLESIAITEGLAPGSEFPLGQTTVTYTAIDVNGNSVNSSFVVTVIDNEVPVIACPEDIKLNVEFGTETVVVNYATISATDNCSETNIELIEGYASGEEFPLGETIVTYEVTDASGNTASCSFTVSVEEDPEETPPAPTVPEVDLIQPDCVTPTGVILINTEDGLIYSIDGENYLAVEEFTELEPGIYQVTAKDEFDQISEATIVTLEEPIASEIETSTISLCIDDSTFDLFELLEGEYDTSGVWVDTEETGALIRDFIDPAMLAIGTYTFEYQLNNGSCSSTTEVTVSINDDCVVLPCSLEDIRSSISKAVTPRNGGPSDNKNDYFTIDFASECGFTYDLMIFNRWGNKIYEATNYQNDWDGYSTNSATSSNQLPSGTYFYILEIRNSGFDPLQGYIYLGTK